MPTIARPTARTLGVAALITCGAVVLTACGSSAAGGRPSAANSATDGGKTTNGANQPGATGKIAEISGRTMQVQNPQNGQVAVKWTGRTTFTHPVTVALSEIKAGDCVLANSPTGSARSSFTATLIMVSKPANGQCGGPATAQGGPSTPQQPIGMSRGAPSGAVIGGPSGMPTDLASGAVVGGPRQAGAFAAGTVISVAGSSIVVAARDLGSAKTTNRTVSVNSKTKISTQQATTAASLNVGLCIAARGKADTTGTVTATSITITNPIHGQCAITVGTHHG